MSWDLLQKLIRNISFQKLLFKQSFEQMVFKGKKLGLKMLSISMHLVGSRQLKGREISASDLVQDSNLSTSEVYKKICMITKATFKHCKKWLTYART